MSEQRLHITFICSGNICRSPMAAKMFAHQIAERGLDDFEDVLSVIEAALPGLHDWVDDQLADSGIAG